MELAREMLSCPFLVRALMGGILVSLRASLLGVSLVLKRYSMIGNRLFHVSFGVLSVVLAIGWSPLKLSILVVVLVAFFLLWITENGKMRSDAATAMISTSALAVGIVVTFMITGMTTDVSSYMFGSIPAVSPPDMRLSVALLVIVLELFLFYYNKIFAMTFDESFAKATGVWVSWHNILIAALTAVTIVLGMRIMGAMPTFSLTVFPALTSMRALKSFRGVVLPVGVVFVACFGIGMVMSYRFSTPVGASVVLVNLAVFILFVLAQIVIRKLIRKG